MSAYSAPERNTGTFISNYHPKKILSTDHTHSDLGEGDAKKASNNTFTGNNTFSGETTFTNINPVSLMTNSGSTSLKFKQSTLESDPAGSLTYFTGENANGDLIMSANKVFLRNQAGTDPVVLESDKMTFSNDALFNANVGIGTSSPQRLLHLNNGSGDVYLQMTCRDSGATTSDGFHIRQEAGLIIQPLNYIFTRIGQTKILNLNLHIIQLEL